MATAQEWLKKPGTRVEGGKGLYKEEKLRVDRLALHKMERLELATGLTSMGLSILLGRVLWRGYACQLNMRTPCEIPKKLWLLR
jgi:hypothetical protein